MAVFSNGINECFFTKEVEMVSQDFQNPSRRPQKRNACYLSSISKNISFYPKSRYLDAMFNGLVSGNIHGKP